MNLQHTGRDNRINQGVFHDFFSTSIKIKQSLSEENWKFNHLKNQPSS